MYLDCLHSLAVSISQALPSYISHEATLNTIFDWMFPGCWIPTSFKLNATCRATEDIWQPLCTNWRNVPLIISVSMQGHVPVWAIMSILASGELHCGGAPHKLRNPHRYGSEGCLNQQSFHFSYFPLSKHIFPLRTTSQSTVFKNKLNQFHLNGSPLRIFKLFHCSIFNK